MEKKIAEKKTITREELLKAISELEIQLPLEGFSSFLDWKESLGFGRYEECANSPRIPWQE